MWEKELEISKILAIKAGEEIMKIYEMGGGDIHYKKDDSPLTSADKASNKIIIEGLKASFPKYAILSEEEKDSRERFSNDYCFIIDPLDGTKEFIKKNGQFTVNIALSYQHRSVMGVIYVPATKELYYAAEGLGAYKQFLEGTVPDKIHVSDNDDIKTLRVVVSNSHGCEHMEELIRKYQFSDFVKIGSSLKGCMVAEGIADIYYRYNPTMEWDTAAMQCIVEEAGGILRQMDDSEMLYNRECSLNDKGFYAINKECNRFY